MPQTQTDTTTTTADTTTSGTTDTTQTASTTPDQDLVAKLVSERVAEELKEIKSKLDKSFAQRDAAQAKLDEMERNKRDADIARLTEEGKHREAYELQLADLRKENETLKSTNTELSRDSAVRASLGVLSLKNDKAFEVAFRDIVGQLVQNAQGQWVHKSGVTIKDFVEAYSKDESQSFLFKPKSSSGAGTSTQTSTGTSTSTKSLFQMSQKEVLEMAAKGQFGAV